jgi:speckle-type POZ protein
MYATEKLADITIITSDKKEIKAHNFVLSRSPVFDAMLNVHDTQESQQGTISITDIDHDVLVEMIRYMYTDEIPKIKDMGCKLLLAADKYDLQGLASECGNYLIKNVAVESFAEVLITADNLEIPQLKDAAIDFVIKNRKDIFTCEGWKRLKKNHIELAMEVLEKYVATA